MSVDERVQAAARHWASRFIANGVDYNDFVRTTARVERWEAWLEEWTRTAEEYVKIASEAEAARHLRTAGEAYLDAAVCLHFGKFVWVVDMERHRLATVRAVDLLRRAHRYLDPAAERIEVPLDRGYVAGNLRRPSPVASAAPPPLVLLIPGLDSTKEEFFRWEEVFLTRGMATLSMDGPGQGESGVALPIRFDYEVAVAAVLDAVRDREDVDLSRVGIAGVSLGGYYAPRAAAFEPRIRAVVGVSGAYDFGEVWDQLPPLTRATFVAKSGAGDEREAQALSARLNLSAVVDRLEQPALMVTGRLDSIIPWQQTERIAREAPNGRFVLFDEGTHVCNNVPTRYRPLVADWMRERLLE